MERIKLYGTQWSTHEEIRPNVTNLRYQNLHLENKPIHYCKSLWNAIAYCTDVWMYYMTFKYQSRFTTSLYIKICVYSYFRPYDNQNSGTFIMYRNIDSDGNVMEVF